LRIGAGATSYWDSAHAVIGVGYTSGATSSSVLTVVGILWDMFILERPFHPI